MNLGTRIFVLVIAGTIVLFGLSAFPGIKNALFSDTTGMSPMTALGVKSIPYALVFFIFYIAYFALKGKGQSG